MEKKIVIAWGRFNPPTTGHGVVMDRVAREAMSRSADYAIFASKTENPKKDPLSFRDKIKFLKQSFPKHSKNINSNARLRTVIQVMQHLERKYDEVIMVVGSDRIMDFKKLLTRYNKKDYTFNKIDVVSAGERDPDSEGVSGMSASKMRAAAVAGNYNLFKTGTPLKNPKSLYNTLRKKMNISEDAEPLNELTKAAKVAMGAIAVAALSKKKKKKIGKTPKIGKKEKLKSADKLMRGGIGGPRFIRMLRFGLIKDVGDIPLTKRAFADFDYSQTNPILREKVFSVTNRAFDILLHDDIIYRRMLLLLHKGMVFGESVESGKNNYVVSFSDSNTTEKFLNDVHSEIDVTWVSNDVRDVQFSLDENKSQMISDMVSNIGGDMHKFDGDIRENFGGIDSSIVKVATSLEKKSKEASLPYNILVEVYSRGLQAWKDNKTAISQDQWAYSRVNSFISGGASRTKYDSDLWNDHLNSNKCNVLFEEFMETEPEINDEFLVFLDEKGDVDELGTKKALNRYKKKTPGEKPGIVPLAAPLSIQKSYKAPTSGPIALSRYYEEVYNLDDAFVEFTIVNQEK